MRVGLFAILTALAVSLAVPGARAKSSIFIQDPNVCQCISRQFTYDENDPGECLHWQRVVSGRFVDCGVTFKEKTKVSPEETSTSFSTSFDYAVLAENCGKDEYGLIEDCNFAGKDLRGYEIGENLPAAKFNFKNANLSGADLSEGHFMEGSDFTNADLQGTNLKGAVLDGVKLAGANLKDAILDKASLARANLKGAVLAGANLKDAILR